jgi:DNA-binding NarL/FixJ family response regulator
MPSVQFIMLTIYEDGNRLFKSLIAGASGYLLKRTPPDKLLAAIRKAHAGGAPMTPEIARRVVQHFQQAPEPAPDLPRLTAREKDVLDQLTKGFLYKEIEENLGISTGTLRSYIANVYEKLHVHSRTEAVVKYLGRLAKYLRPVIRQDGALAWCRLGSLGRRKPATCRYSVHQAQLWPLRSAPQPIQSLSYAAS